MARIVLSLIVATAMFQEQTVWSQADWRWLAASRDAAFDALLPVALQPGQTIAYRTYRDLYQDVPEQYLAVTSDPAGGSDGYDVIATRITPVGTSIQEQLLVLHRAHPTAPLPTLLKQVAVRRLTVASKECPPLRHTIDALPGVESPVAKRDLIVIHPDVHRFVIRMGTTHMDVTHTDDSPLVKWAAATATVIETCATARK